MVFKDTMQLFNDVMSLFYIGSSLHSLVCYIFNTPLFIGGICDKYSAFHQILPLGEVREQRTFLSNTVSGCTLIACFYYDVTITTIVMSK